MFNNLVIQSELGNLHIGRGLGQGWGISCLLFNIFTNDLTTQILQNKVLYPQIFADDTNIASYGLNNLDAALDTCEDWAQKNDMQINKKKSKILFMGGRMQYDAWELAHNKEYRVYGIALQYKSLGVIIQRDSLFNKQAHNIINKANNCNRMINILKRVNANPEYRIIVWYTHIQSHFRYASLIWNDRLLNWKERRK